MRHIAHILSVTQTNAIGQVVKHHPVAIAVVAHIGGQQRGISASHQALRTAPRLPPRDPEGELLTLYHARRDHHALTKLRQKREESAGVRLVAEQGAVGELPAAQRDGARHQ
jgi:hypothetical protein